MTGRYVEVPYPWRAAVDVSDAEPARHYVRLIGQALRYGSPGRRRPWPAWLALAHVGVPEAPAQAVLRRLPRRVARPELDALRDGVVRAWPRLAAALPALPPVPPELSLLALQRSAGLTVFVFGGGPAPLLVLKRGGRGVATETAALERARGSGVAPLPLGVVDGADVQQGLPGAPLTVTRITPATGGDVPFPPGLEAIARGLVRLTEATVEATPPNDSWVSAEAALDRGPLSPRAARSLAAALRDARRVRVSVLRHRDTSPQNCLVGGDRLHGIVDWELAVGNGLPGFDVLNAAASWLDHGIGLGRWSTGAMEEAFAASWAASPLWTGARAAARACGAAAGIEASTYSALEVVFFGARVGDRLLMPGFHPTGPATAARILDVVCAD